MPIQYSPILAHTTKFPANTAYKTYLTNGDDFYDTVEEAIADAVYQTRGLHNRGTTALSIISTDNITGDTHVVMAGYVLHDAMETYERSQMTGAEVAEDNANTIGDMRRDERVGA